MYAYVGNKTAGMYIMVLLATGFFVLQITFSRLVQEISKQEKVTAKEKKAAASLQVFLH